MIIRVILMGRITQDLELKSTPSGVSVLTFSIYLMIRKTLYLWEETNEMMYPSNTPHLPQLKNPC